MQTAAPSPVTRGLPPSPFPPSRHALRVLALAIGCAVILAPGPVRAVEPVTGPAYLDREGNPLPFENDEQVLEFLRRARVLGVRELSGGTTRPLRLDLEHEGIRARAVFRNVDRRRERLRMRDGSSYAVFYDRAEHEVAAYRLSRLLGLTSVPPTVFREHDGQDGTLQLWVERARTEKQRREEGDAAPRPVDWMRQRAVMEAFDALIGNSDRNTGNSLVDERWRLWMIDHTRAFQRPRGEPDLGKVNHVPEELLRRLRELDAEALHAALDDVLEPTQVAAVEQRRRSLLTHVDRLIAERGRGAVVLEGSVGVVWDLAAEGERGVRG